MIVMRHCSCSLRLVEHEVIRPADDLVVTVCLVCDRMRGVSPDASIWGLLDRTFPVTPLVP